LTYTLKLAKSSSSSSSSSYASCSWHTAQTTDISLNHVLKAIIVKYITHRQSTGVNFHSVQGF